MAIELGTAYISILPSTSKLTAGINSSLRTAERQSATTGKRMGGNLTSGIKKSMAGLAVAGGGIAAAIGFGALVKEAGAAADSITKFKQTMKFAGIGTKDIEKATKATQDYANATVYGLADVQSTTAQLASNGIKDYVGLTKAAGNLNAVAGGNAETFKSVAMVLTQTAGAGKLTTENYNQLADAIPGASGPIQKALLKNGAYTGNFRDAMAKGQITAQEFNKVISTLGNKPVAVKAATSTQTFEGAIGGLKASIVTALLPAMVALQPVFSKFAGFIAEKVVPAFTTFGGYVKDNFAPVFERIKGAFTGVNKGSGELGKTFSALTTFGKALAPVIADFGSKLSATVGPAFKAISNVVSTQLLPAFRAMLPTITPIVGFILKMLGSSIIGVIQGTVRVIIGLINIITGVFKVIKGVLTGNWKLAWDGVKQILSGALKAILGAIQVWMNWGILGIFKHGIVKLVALVRSPWAVIKNIVTKGMGAVKNVMGSVWGVIRAAVGRVWAGIKGLLFGAFRSIRTGVTTYFAAYRAIIGRVWSVIKSVTSAVWGGIRAVLSGAFSLIRSAVTGAFNTYKSIIVGVWNTIKSSTSTIWNAIKATISGVWTRGIKPIFTALGNFITGTVVPAFRTGVSKIGTIWNGLKSLASKPVEFLVNTVYMSGIRAMMNKIPGVSLPTAHFAKGGPVKGGIPGKDSVNALMMPGEHVLTAEEVKRAGGHKNILALRAALKRGELGKSFDPDPPRFAKGGMLNPDAIRRAQAFARAQVGKPYVWGGVGPGGYDCSGFMSAITNVLRGNNPYSRVGATASFPWSGFKPGVGEFTIGSTPNYGGSGVGHMAGTLAGLKVESYGGHGPSVSHRGYNDSGFNTIAHLGAGGAAAAKSGGFFSIISDIKELVGKLKGFLSGFSKFGEWGGIIKHAATSAASSMKNYINDKIPGPGPIPSLFDNGGVLRPGQLAYNASGKPEAVFNNSQFKQFAEGRTSNNNSGARRTEFVITNWDKGTGFFREIAADEISGSEQFNNTRRRMGTNV